MAPEYAIDGLFSVKSDVFSFGVLVLEIVSGKRNRGFSHPNHDLNLVGHVSIEHFSLLNFFLSLFCLKITFFKLQAWKLWSEGRPHEIIDPSIDISSPTSESEILRCIQVGLLCVQQRPEDRPTMSSALLMLDSEYSTMPQPRKPGFYTERFFLEKDSSSTENASYTSNEITSSMIHGR